jgi:hypothetical protein
MIFKHRGCEMIAVLRGAAPLCLWLGAASAHQDSCHRLHSCPSDHNTDVCATRGAATNARIITIVWRASRAGPRQ